MVSHAARNIHSRKIEAARRSRQNHKKKVVHPPEAKATIQLQQVNSRPVENT